MVQASAGGNPKVHGGSSIGPRHSRISRELGINPFVKSLLCSLQSGPHVVYTKTIGEPHAMDV